MPPTDYSLNFRVPVSWRVVLVAWLRSLFCLGLLLPSAASASHEPRNRIVAQAWAEDVTGRLTVSEAQRQLEWVPFSGMLMRGYGQSTLWVRLTIDATSSARHKESPLLLRLRPTFLDLVVVHDPVMGAAPVVVGDTLDVMEQDFHSPALIVPITRAHEVRDIWVEIRTNSTRFANFELLTQDDVQVADTQLLLMAAGLLGLIAFVLIWTVVMMVPKASALLLAFAFTQVMAFVFAFWLLGLAQLLLVDVLPSSWMNHTMSVSSSLYVLGINIFMYLLLNELRIPKWSHAVFLALLLPLVVSWWMLFNGQASVALQLNPVQALLAMLVYLALSYVAEDSPSVISGMQPRVPRRIILFYNGLVLTLFALYVPAVTGMLNLSRITVFVPVLYSLVNGLLMLGVLQYRHIQIHRSQARLRIEAAVVRSQIQQEREHRKEKDKLLSMLGHELKTPLATIQILLTAHDAPQALSLGVGKSIAAMRNLLDRSVQANRLEVGDVVVREARCCLRDLLPQWVRDCAEPERVDVEQVVQPCRLRTDPHLLGIVVGNLLDNALRYSPPGSRVHVTLGQASAGQCALTVVNELGDAGRPDAALVFSKFYRSAGARRKTGSGLGLFIAQQLAGLLGGTLVFASEAERVSFRLTLSEDQS